VLIGCLCLIAFVAITGILVGRFGEIQWRIIFTALAVVTFCGTALLAGRAGDDAPLVFMAGLFCSVFAAFLAFAAIWSDDPSETLLRWLGAFAYPAAAAAQMGLLIANARDEESELSTTIRNWTVIGTAVLGVLAALGSLMVQGDGGGFARLMGVLSVVVILGTLVLPVLRRLEAQPAREPADS
jgi:hypothetical protein